MALTLAGYLYRKANKQEEDVGMDVRHLEILKPMIAKGVNAQERQVVRISATAERPLKSAKISYSSISPDGTETDLHATCIVEYGDIESWIADWSRVSYLYRSRIDVLVHESGKGKYKKVNRAHAYELFSALVHYDTKYHGMKEVIIDSKNFEGTASVEFRATEYDGDFEFSPYWIDNIAHLSGFVLNGSDAVDSTKTVYISHGWESLRIARPLSAGKSYQTYVKMFPGGKKTMAGDVYVFEGDDMVALVGGVKFQAISRAVLNKLLPPINGVTGPQKVPRDGKRKMETAPIPTKPSPKKLAAQAPPQPFYSAPLPATPPGPVHAASSPESGAFLSIIAEELGMELSELADTAAFSDIGVDSLMSLTITGRMREDLDLDVPTSLFTDHATIGAAKAAIFALKDNDLIESIMPDASSNSFPDSVMPDVPISDFSRQAMGADSSEDTTDRILSIISEELGIEESELLDMATFADMGVDSLMSLTITGRIREELDLDVPTSFFTDYPTISEARAAALVLVGISNDSTRSTTPNSSAEDTIPNESLGTPPTTRDQESNGRISPGLQIGPNGKGNPEATSVLLHGNPKTASKTLFLFPNGSGSATSYALFPSIAPGVCVYGLNCPFMKSPEEYTNGIDGVSAQYVTEVKRRQASGPYYLGGWSAGGVIAYEVAHQLKEMGERVERLILIDAPCPIGLEPLPSSLLHFADSTGLLGTGSTPDWLIPHFEASIINLATYVPYPMDPHQAPKTFMIWARDGMAKDLQDRKYPRSVGEPKSVKFLLDNRPDDFGAYGWDMLLGKENITISMVEGNHFTMIQEPAVRFSLSTSHRANIDIFVTG
jgi:naphtho-gamma-pyrone polyketide synthase